MTVSNASRTFALIIVAGDFQQFDLWLSTIKISGAFSICKMKCTRFRKKHLWGSVHHIYKGYWKRKHVSIWTSENHSQTSMSTPKNTHTMHHHSIYCLFWNLVKFLMNSLLYVCFLDSNCHWLTILQKNPMYCCTYKKTR